MRKQCMFSRMWVMFRRWVFSALVLAAGFGPSLAFGANSVVVESKIVQRNATGVTIGVRLTNDVTITALVVPLAIREASPGAFITSLQTSYGERLASSAVLDQSYRKQYASEDGTCNPGPLVGFKTITYSDGTSHPVVASPEGVMFVRIKIAPASTDLSPGTDATGSLILTMNVSGTPGEFEIDTTCTNPSNHLVFIDAVTLASITPSFTKGVVVIAHPVVGNLNDAGPGSLRDAIQFANSHAGLDSITFAVAGVINLLSPLPSITDSSGATKILGFTAPGADPPAIPAVIVDGSSATPGAGLLVQSAGNWIEGLTFRNFKGAGVGGTAWVYFNTITGCRFYGNTGPGIDLGNNGITPNDPGDADNGFNGLSNFPVFDPVKESGTDTFTVKGTTSPFARVELYLAAEAGNAAYQPESTTNGPAYLFLEAVYASQFGDFTFPPIVLPEWSRVTATATDSAGNTSEFSKNAILTPDPMAITAYSEPVPPLPGTLAMPQVPAAIQIIVHSPLNSQGLIDSIGPTFNTFGLRGVYQSTIDYNAGGKPDTRVTIMQPDPGIYKVDYILVGDPGNYAAGIGIDGHSEIRQTVAFAASGQDVPATFELAPPVRGELNGDGVIDVFDVIAAIDVVFGGAPAPDPPELVDVNCDSVSDVFDVIYLIDYSFGGGPAPCQ